MKNTIFIILFIIIVIIIILWFNKFTENFETPTPTFMYEKTSNPTFMAIETPTEIPTEVPAIETETDITFMPEEIEESIPTFMSTEAPTQIPTFMSTEAPTQIPTFMSTETPTFMSTETPTPTFMYTETPTQTPTFMYTQTPTQIPIFMSTETPTPIFMSTETPTFMPEETEEIVQQQNECTYDWKWGQCDLATGLVTRNLITIPPENGDATSCTPAPNDSIVSIKCLKALDFSSRLYGWNVLYSEPNIRNEPFLISVYTTTSNEPETNGFTKPSSNFINYVRVKFDNTSSRFANYANPTITLLTSVPNLAPGNYLMTYYIQSRISELDTQSISITAAVNKQNNTPFLFRTVAGESLVKPGLWVPQKLAFTISPDDPASTNVQFIFQLFDTQTISDNIVAVGGIKIESCGEQPCNVDCTYIYGDWGYCDFVSGTYTRKVKMIPAMNNGIQCVVPPENKTKQSCFDSLNFVNSEMNNLPGWIIQYNPPNVYPIINLFVTTAENDNEYKFDNTDAMFNTPYTIVSMNNKDGKLTSVTNPSVSMKTVMKLAVGNYRMTYYVQSANDSQSIEISCLFGTTNTKFNFKNNVIPGVWFPQAIEFTVTNEMDPVIPIEFKYTLTNNTKGLTHAVAMGGIQIVSCGDNLCPKDCMYVWDYWQKCMPNNKTYRDPLIIINSENGGMKCPTRETKDC